MGRPRKHGGMTPHPSPRYRDKIRMYVGVSGASDRGWRATYYLDGAWTPKPISLGRGEPITDFVEACEVARDRYAALLANNGAEPEKTDYSFARFAGAVISELSREKIASEAINKRKGHTQGVQISRIQAIAKQFGTMDIRQIDQDFLDDWARRFRVPTSRKPGEPATKRPAATTLGNYDWSFSKVWEMAARAKVVSRIRPKIPKQTGEKSISRATFEGADCRKIVKLIQSDTWLMEDYPGNMLLRTYIALLATTGMRPGLELERTQIGNVKVDRNQIVIFVNRNAGKHEKSRVAIVNETDISFPARGWLLELLAWQEKRGAKPTDTLFSGVFAEYSKLVSALIKRVGVEYDTSGDKRVAYSFRHYYATVQISKGITAAQLAKVMGTSEQMIDGHYNKWFLLNNREVFAGTEQEQNQAIIDRWQTDDTGSNQPDVFGHIPEYEDLD